MKDSEIHGLLTRWNRLYDAVIKFDEYFSEIMDDDGEEMDFGEEELDPEEDE